MPSDDDTIIIRNGTFEQWLKYRVKFGKSVEYGDDTDAHYAVAGYVLVIAALLVGVVVGAIFG